MNSKFFIFFSLTLTTLSSSAGELWAINCDSGLGYITLKKNNSELVVNSNQIVISASTNKNEESKISFFLNEPLDLGRGGMMLKWEDFSKQKPIAMANINGSEMHLSWYGFFDSKQDKYVWVSESDFSSKNNKNVTLFNCE